MKIKYASKFMEISNKLLKTILVEYPLMHLFNVIKLYKLTSSSQKSTSIYPSIFKIGLNRPLCTVGNIYKIQNFNVSIQRALYYLILAKAFDLVNCELLLQILENNGFRGLSYKLLQNY